MRCALPSRRGCQPGPFGSLRTESRWFNELARPLGGAPLCGLNWAVRIRRRGARSVEFSGNRPVHTQPPLGCKRMRGTSSCCSWSSTSKSGGSGLDDVVLCGTDPWNKPSSIRRLMPRELKLVVLAGAARDETEDAGREGLCRRRVLLSRLRPAVFCSLGTRAGTACACRLDPAQKRMALTATRLAKYLFCRRGCRARTCRWPAPTSRAGRRSQP